MKTLQRILFLMNVKRKRKSTSRYVLEICLTKRFSVSLSDMHPPLVTVRDINVLLLLLLSLLLLSLLLSLLSYRCASFLIGLH